MKASTHRSGVGVDAAAVERDYAGGNSDGSHASRLAVTQPQQSTPVKASTPSGPWGGFMKASAYGRSVGVDITVVERDCATPDGDATSTLPSNGSMSVKASTPTGRWGGFMKKSAYLGCVVMDVAVVQCDCTTDNVDATSPLPNNKARQ